VADIRYDLFSVDDHIVEPAEVWSSRVRLTGITHAKTALHAGDPCPEMHIGTNMLERCGLPLGANGRCPAGHQSVQAGA
jgi:hypothetical protein